MPTYAIDENGFIIGRVSFETGLPTCSRRGSEWPVCHHVVRKVAKHIRTQHPSYQAPVSGSESTDRAPSNAESNRIRPPRKIKFVLVSHARTPETAAPPVAPAPPATPGSSTSQRMAQCPYCHCAVRRDRLQKHVASRCPKRAMPQAPRGKGTKPGMTDRDVQKTSRETNGERTKLEALRQSDYESRFGEKYVGQSHREWDGKFGSIPLHDDYGDEADAE